MKHLVKMLTLLVIGGMIYCLLELLHHGSTHWTMFIAGGMCFVLIGAINEIYTYEMALPSQMLLSAILITAVEFVTGLIVNVWLGWGVWDYSGLPYNLSGQICLLFFCLWFLLSLIAILLDDWMRYFLFAEEKPHYKLL